MNPGESVFCIFPPPTGTTSGGTRYAQAIRFPDTFLRVCAVLIFETHSPRAERGGRAKKKMTTTTTTKKKKKKKKKKKAGRSIRRRAETRHRVAALTWVGGGWNGAGDPLYSSTRRLLNQHKSVIAT